jgi:hypothetical protein
VIPTKPTDLSDEDLDGIAAGAGGSSNTPNCVFFSGDIGW